MTDDVGTDELLGRREIIERIARAGNKLAQQTGGRFTITPGKLRDFVRRSRAATRGSNDDADHQL